MNLLTIVQYTVAALSGVCIYEIGKLIYAKLANKKRIGRIDVTIGLRNFEFDALYNCLVFAQVASEQTISGSEFQAMDQLHREEIEMVKVNCDYFLGMFDAYVDDDLKPEPPTEINPGT